jgi:hypothetical protein
LSEKIDQENPGRREYFPLMTQAEEKLTQCEQIASYPVRHFGHGQCDMTVLQHVMSAMLFMHADDIYLVLQKMRMALGSISICA